MLIFLLTIYDLKMQKARKEEAENFFDDSEVKYLDDSPEKEQKRAKEEYENMKKRLLEEETKEEIAKEKKEKLTEKKPSLLDGITKDKIIPASSVNKEVINPVIREDSSQAIEIKIPSDIKENLKKSTFSSVSITGDAIKEVPQAEDLRKTMELKIIDDHVFKNNEESKEIASSNINDNLKAIYIDNQAEEEKASARLRSLFQDNKDSELFDIVDKEMEDLPEYEDEKDLIISVKDLERQAEQKYEENEKTQYQDEETPISIDELYQTMNLKVINEEELKKDNKNFSDYLPDFDKVDPIELEKTMNLSDINKEIEKANEYLETLKTLKDNLRKQY